MQVARSLEEGVWKSFVDRQPGGNIFQTPEMFQVFARTKGYRPDLWAVTGDSDEVLALFTPVLVTLFNGPLRRLTTRAVAYGGVLCHDSEEGRAALRLLLDSYARQAARDSLFTELRHLHDAGCIQPVLAECGFAYEAHLNYLIDLNRPAESVLQSIGPRTRKKIRKALRDGQVRVSEIEDQARLGDWYTTLQKTYDNARVPLADQSMFEAAFDVLQPKRMAKFLLAEVDGVPVACSIELQHRDTIYGWYGGCDRAYGDFVPNELVIWHILEWGANNGYRVYDFGGAGRPDEEYGVRDFKAKFGGRLVCFGRSTREHAPHLLKLSKSGYSLYRKLKSPRSPQPAASA